MSDTSSRWASFQCFELSIILIQRFIALIFVPSHKELTIIVVIRSKPEHPDRPYVRMILNSGKMHPYWPRCEIDGKL